MQRSHIHAFRHNLHLVDLDQTLTGYRQFISSWIYQHNGQTFVIDPGPRSTIPKLVQALNQLDIHHIDFILLTHIHIDHAGGTGVLSEHFPDAEVISHPKGIKHMIEPTKLWEGSLKVLGKVARAYGSIAPVPEHKIGYSERLPDPGIEIIESPGHASHHICYRVEDILFAGEVAGVRIPNPNGPDLLRIATPPVFIYEIYKDSLDRVSQSDADTMCFGHYGLCNDLERVFESAQAQLALWMEIVQKHFNPEADTAKAENRIYQEIMERDPSIKGFDQLPSDIREREKYFCRNSIRGIYQYFQKQYETP